MQGVRSRADLEETAAAAGTAPKPSRFMPIPNRSMSCALPLGLETAGTDGVDFVTGDFALTAAAVFADSAATRTRSASSAFSRSRSYPSCRMRSASSAAFLSASAKSTGAAFFAPRPPSLDFFAPAEALPATDVADEFRREAPSLDAGREPAVEELERRDAELTVRGPVGALEALAERPITGGAAGLEDVGAGLGAAGLSHDEKKSSSSPPAFGVGAAEMSAAPSTTIFSGYLQIHQYGPSKAGYKNSPGNILLHAARKLLLVQLCDAARVFLLGIRVAEQCSTAMLVEELVRGGVSADFHGAQLIELPTVQVGGTSADLAT